MRAVLKCGNRNLRIGMCERVSAKTPPVDALRPSKKTQCAIETICFFDDQGVAGWKQIDELYKQNGNRLVLSLHFDCGAIIDIVASQADFWISNQGSHVILEAYALDPDAALQLLS